MVCNSCQRNIADGSRFCYNCGAKQAMLNRGKRRYGNDDPRAGSKSLWIWEYHLGRGVAEETPDVVRAGETGPL